jgi:hypothetical protein
MNKKETIMDLEVFIPITLFVVIGYMIKVISDNRVRHKIIEKGDLAVDPDKLYGKEDQFKSMSSLKWGLVLTGIGLALFIGQLFPRIISEEMTVGGMFIFAGLAFLVYYFIAKKQMVDNNQQALEQS